MTGSSQSRQDKSGSERSRQAVTGRLQMDGTCAAHRHSHLCPCNREGRGGVGTADVGVRLRRLVEVNFPYTSMWIGFDEKVGRGQVLAQEVEIACVIQDVEAFTASFLQSDDLLRQNDLPGTAHYNANKHGFPTWPISLVYI